MVSSVSTRPTDDLLLDLDNDEWDAVLTMLNRMRTVEQQAMNKGLEQFEPEEITRVMVKIRGRETQMITVTPDEFVIISDAIYDTFGRHEPTVTPAMETAKETVHTIDRELGEVELKRTVANVLQQLESTNNTPNTPSPRK